ncbi:YdcH family protein [Azospirillum halopraeferens]|uniref:YdcH family protein n=1 Tax=Azospirillum halopraeferens TaxID=34010 RepID=UPI0003F7E133|nr:YdcH family protein [Azospirillum halopraeferens]
MACEDRIESLRMKHQALEQELKREALRPYPDDSVLVRIKKQKLRLKDEMIRLARA